MVFSGLLAMAYDFVLNSLGWWQEVLSTMTFSWGQAAADKYKLAFSLDNDAALLGIGYFTGLRYAAIIAAGSFFSWFVCIPVVYYLGGDHIMTIGGQSVLLANASIDDVFSQYVRHIGIGMLAMAGIIGLVSMSGVVGRVMKKSRPGYVLIKRHVGNGPSPDPAGYAHEPNRHRHLGHGSLIHPLFPRHLLAEHYPDTPGRRHYHHLLLHAVRRRHQLHCLYGE